MLSLITNMEFCFNTAWWLLQSLNYFTSQPSDGSRWKLWLGFSSMLLARSVRNSKTFLRLSLSWLERIDGKHLWVFQPAFNRIQWSFYRNFCRTSMKLLNPFYNPTKFSFPAVSLMFKNFEGILLFGVPIYCALLLTMGWRANARINSFQNLPKMFAAIGGIFFIASDSFIGKNETRNWAQSIKIFFVSSSSIRQVLLADSIFQDLGDVYLLYRTICHCHICPWPRSHDKKVNEK